MAIRLFFMLFWVTSVFASSENFKQALKEILDQDPELQSVEFDTDWIEANKIQTLSNFVLPSVELSYSKIEQHNNISQVVGQSKYNVGSLVANLSLFSFGSDYQMFRAGRAKMNAQNAKVLNQLIKKESDISQIYFQSLQQKKNLIILKKILDLKEKTKNISDSRFSSGALSLPDFEKVKLDVSNARGEYLLAEQNLELNESKLNVYKRSVIVEEFPWLTKLNDKDFNELLSMRVSITELPQFKEIAFEMESSERENKSRLSNMFGNVNFQFSRSMIDFDDYDQYEWRTLLTYSLPLFDRFNQYTDYQQSLAKRKSLEVRKNYELNNRQSLVDMTEKNLRLSYKNFKERETALLTSQKLYADSLSQFRRGTLSVNELLIDQDRLLRTEQLANQSLTQVHLNLMNFCHARGKALLINCL